MYGHFRVRVTEIDFLPVKAIDSGLGVGCGGQKQGHRTWRLPYFLASGTIKGVTS